MKLAKWIILIISSIAIVGYFAISKVFQKDPINNAKHAKYKLGSYYIPFEITELNHHGIPCLPILIENQTVLLTLDVGSSAQICLHKEICDQLNQRTFLRLRKSVGVRGIEYEKKVYNIPKIQIGKVSFWHPLLEEESESFQKDSIIYEQEKSESIRKDAIVSEQKDAAPVEKGRLGWGLFQISNLFLDLGNSKIAICDSLSTLSKNGYLLDSFVKTPLILDNNIIQIEVNNDQLPLLCCLDTGSTWNLINTRKEVEKPSWNISAPVMICDPIMTGILQINKINFGEIAWHPLPMFVPFRFDAILGMEFFKTHLVFLDFSEQCAYISKKPLSDPQNSK